MMFSIGVGLVIETIADSAPVKWEPLVVATASLVGIIRLLLVGVVLRPDGRVDVRGYLWTRRYARAEIRRFDGGDYSGPLNTLSDRFSSIYLALQDGRSRPIAVVSGRTGRILDLARALSAWLRDPTRPLDTAPPDRSRYVPRRAAPPG